MGPVRAGVAGLVACIGLAACTTVTTAPPTTTTPAEVSTSVPTTTEDPVGEGGTLRYALGADPASIDPRFLADEEGAVVADALFDSLVAVDEDLTTVVPAAARRWDVSDDGRVLTFHLREGATYHDGTPVVARDFVRSFRRIVDRSGTPTSFLHYQLAPVEGYVEAIADGTPLSGVRAVDDETLEVRLSRPSTEFLQVLAHPSLGPSPPTADEEATAFAESPVGNGPFAMAEPWQRNQFIRVTRFADHHDPARLDEVVFQIFAGDPSYQQQYDDFERGQVDVAAVPPARLDEAATSYGRSPDGVHGPGLLTGLTGALYAYGFNTQLPPFDDPAVRRAISRLIDRDRIAEQVLLGAREAATTLVPPSLPGAAHGRCQHCTYDPEAAREELGMAPEPTASPTEGSTVAGGSTASPPDGAFAPPLVDHPIEIVVNAGSTNERIAERVAADIEDALGIEVTTRTAEPAAFVGELRAGEIQVFRLGWTADYASPGAVLQPLFRSDAVDADNLTRFVDEQVDALLDEARRTADVEERLDLYAQAEQRILDLAPVAPIFFYPQNRVVSASVHELRIGPLGHVNLDEVWKEDGS